MIQEMNGFKNGKITTMKREREVNTKLKQLIKQMGEKGMTFSSDHVHLRSQRKTDCRGIDCEGKNRR